MEKLVAMDKWIQKNELTEEQAWDRISLNDEYAFVRLGNADNHRINVPAHLRLSKFNIMDLKHLFLNGNLNKFEWHIFHALQVQVQEDGNNLFMPFDLVMDRYFNNSSYIHKYKESDLIKSDDSDEQLNISQEPIMPTCPVAFKHEEFKRGDENFIKISDTSRTYIQEKMSVFPRFCRIKPLSSTTNLEEIKKLYPDIVVALFARHFSSGDRQCSYKDMTFTLTVQPIQISSIFIYENEPNIKTARVPEYLDCSDPTYANYDRAIAFNAVSAVFNENRYPHLSASARASKALQGVGFDYDVDDAFTEHYSSVFMPPDNPRRQPLRKKEKE